MRDQQSLRAACAYVQSNQSLCYLLEYSMTVNLMTEHTPFGVSKLERGLHGSSMAIHVEIPHCWKYHAVTHILIKKTLSLSKLYNFHYCNTYWFTASKQIPFFLVGHNYYPLLSRLLVLWGTLYWKQCRPRLNWKGGILARVHSVWFHCKIKSVYT